MAGALRYVAVSCLVLIQACAAPGPEHDDSLYRALGERPGITAIVDETLRTISRDRRIVEVFADADISRVQEKLVEQICDISGGPCEYSGDPMDEAHADLDIAPPEFNAFVEDLQIAMERLSIPISAQNRLVARFAPMREDILNGQAADAR
ncbi:MAG: group 1 truncated hemoglobin [Halofilum sp. (in: g-proteobacteria)]